MVELVIVAAFVLLPLFLAMPLLGKYIDIRTAAVDAARYAAWERTVWYDGSSATTWGLKSNAWLANTKSDAQLRNELRVRLLSNSKDAFMTSDGGATDFKGGSRDLWQTHERQPMLATYDDAGNSMSNGNAPGFATDLLGPVIAVADMVGSTFTLDTQGAYSATVNLTIRNTDLDRFQVEGAASLPTQFVFSESNVILANGWNAGGPDSSVYTSVMSQTNGLTPTAVFKINIPFINVSVGDLITKFMTAAFPEFAKLELGKIEPDVIPEDRKK
jgi:hypothetical protein